MYFDNILGQDIPKKFIVNSINKERVSHAYLFEGPDGVGKKSFAIEFSKILLNYKGIENSPDFNILKPDGASFKIDQIRKIQSDVIIKPYSSKKIYILEECEKMTIQAQNSLLKTLEEPPEYVMIILLTENSSSLLDTIKSRCEILKFSPLPQIKIENYLIKNKDIDKNKARVLASFSFGILSKALNLIESEEFNKKREELENVIELLLNKSTINLLSVNSYFDSHKEEINNLLDMIITYFRDIIIVKEEIDERLIINLDKLELLKQLSKKLTYSQISRIIDIMEETKKKIISNCNFSLSVQVMGLNIQEVIK